MIPLAIIAAASVLILLITRKHLWKCVNAAQPLPPSILVGIKELGTITQ